MKRHALLVLTLIALASCDAPLSTSAPSVEIAPATPAEAEWIKDTVPLVVPQSGAVAAEWDPDDLFPFHIYWHTGGGGVPERIRVAVRRAAAKWASIINPTAVLPYVYQQAWSCAASDDAGNTILWRRYSAGDRLDGGFHLYVTSHRGISWQGGLAYGPCIPRAYDAATDKYRYAYHPVTGAPPNGTIFMSAPIITWNDDDVLENLAAHEIGHNLGLGIGDRWDDGFGEDSVLVDNTHKHFLVQTDTVAIKRYIALAEQSWWTDAVYPLRKIPLRDYAHWHHCTLWRDLPEVSMDLMAGVNQGVITQVSASMLQGFLVNWDTFGDPANQQTYWTPRPSRFEHCPEVRLHLESLGLDGEDADSVDVADPDFPLFDGDIRPWAYAGSGN